MYEQLIDSGIDPATLIVAGDSGGGGLSTSLVVELRERELPPPAALVLFSPEVDLDLDQPSVAANASRDILPWNIPVTSYLHGVQPNDARVSAMHAHPDWFPPTFVALGSDEMFRDGIAEFAEHLGAAGVDTESHEEEGMFHVFPIVMPWAGAAKRVFAAMDDFVALHVESKATAELGDAAEPESA